DITDTLSYSSDEEDLECPLCMEEIDVTDKYFKPCPCGYQICRFCWNHIKENLNGLCPACRGPYLEDTVEFTPVTPEELLKIKTRKKKKERERKEQEVAARRHLANIRVVQKNLVYVLGLPAKICSEEILRSNDYFGQYGKINRIVVNRRGHTSAPIITGIGGNGVYVTFARKEDATKSIEAVDGSVYDGKIIRATYGTTKYCSYFLRGQICQNPNCQYLHEAGEEADGHPKEELGILKENKIPKPPPFPIPSNKKDDKEESILPPTANWAKHGKAVHQSTTVSPYNSSHPGTSLTPETDFDSDVEMPPLSRSKDVERLNSENTQSSKRGKAKANSKVNFGNPPPGLRGSDTTPTTPTSSIRETSSLSQQSELEIMGSSALEENEIHLSPTSTEQSSSPLRIPQQRSTEPVIENINLDEESQSSNEGPISIVNSGVTFSLGSYGLNLQPKYSGPFDPFGVDALSLLASRELAALRNVNGDSNTDVGFGRFDPFREEASQAASVSRSDSSAKRSRFEKFFNAEQEQNFESESPESQRKNAVQETYRSLFPNGNVSFTNSNIGFAAAANLNSRQQQLSQLPQQLPFGYPNSLRVNPQHFGPPAGLSVRQQQELLHQQQQQQQQQQAQ
ncbi:transcriptional repressor general negative regulator of transcription subunit 4, partial [Nowakowskiella sp. JEL0078]